MNVRPCEELASGRLHQLRAVAIVAALALPALGAPSAFAVDAATTTGDPAAATAAATPTAPVAAPAVKPLPLRALGSRVMRPGARGTDVKELQAILRRRGYGISVDGGYGPQTARAVRRFQKKSGLTVSGNADWATLRKLGIRRIRSGAPVTPAPVPAVPAPAAAYPLAGPNAAAAKYLKAFPVGGKHTYSNDFGAPRSQGGHQGNDIMADRGIVVRAVVAGTVTRANRVETGLGGVYVWLRGADGTEYYFAHLNAITAGIEPGSKVTLGQPIGEVGNTGDARFGATHLHFEIRPSGVGPINPYSDLLAVDPEPPVRK